MNARGSGGWAAAWLLTVAVGLAFADASIVVLALPRLYGEFDTTIVGVSWVLTAYAVVVSVVAVALAFTYRWIRPIVMVGVGLVLFAGASLMCGVADSLTALMVGRCLQGAGAALLLTGSLPLLTTLVGAHRGRTAWSLAATIGLATGPALGGLLTQAFDWRSIFLVQAPVAILALAVVAIPEARAASESAPTQSPRLLPALGLLFLSGGLVGALFLSVLLVIEVWRRSPVAGAIIVTALPVGMLLVRVPARYVSPVVRIGAGALLLGAGLLTLARLPEASPTWAAMALAFCGVGLGLLASVFDPAAVGEIGGLTRDGAVSVAARHAGLVLGLGLIAPVLAGSLDAAVERSTFAGTGVVLDARIPIREKVNIAVGMRDALEVAERGAVPDIEVLVAEASDNSPDAIPVGRDVAERVEAILTRSFRSGFTVAAVLGFATVISGLLMVWQGRRREGRLEAATPPVRAYASTTSRFATAGIGVIVLGAGGVLVAAEAAGASEFGTYVEADACAAGPDPFPGSGFDAAVQRLALSTVNGAACEVGMSRERFVLSLDGQARFGGPALDREEIDDAVRVGLEQAAADAEERGDIPSFVLRPLLAVIERAPVSWLLDQLGLPDN